MVPFKALSDQVWIRLYVYNFKNWLISILVSLQKWLSTAGKQVWIIRTSEVNTFEPRKMTISLTLLIR